MLRPPWQEPRSRPGGILCYTGCCTHADFRGPPAATNGTTTGGNSTNTTTTSTRPPITATASEITTGALAGTAVAPAPGVNVPGIAKGPDDSYVNHAHALAAGSLALSVVLGGALLF